LETQKFYLRSKEFSLGTLNQEFVIPQCFQHCGQFEEMLRWIICVSKYQNVVTIDYTVVACDVIP